ncbi:MAG: hypothetical protein J0L82_05225 [Deltaproteobacteria bacterium]|jgi:hypothetical protein|nr:hypothetical protein [Deltaproteobacteria bacterium]
MKALKFLTGLAVFVSGASISQDVNAQSGDLQNYAGLLRTQSTYTWANIDTVSLQARIAERTQNANLIYQLGAQERIVDRAFDVKQQQSLPRSLQYRREGQSFGQSYVDNSTSDINELKHFQITWLSRLLYSNNPEALKALIEKIGPVMIELTASPHNYWDHVSDDQYASGDNGRRQTTLSPEVIGNLVHLLERLERDPKLSAMKNELRSQAMAILNHPSTVEYFTKNLSHGLIDGYSERGVYLRRYFALIEAAQPGIWKSVVARISADPDMLPTSMLVLKYWTTRDLKFFRQLLLGSRWIRSEVFAKGIPGYEPYQILRSNPELLELTVLRALEGLSPMSYHAGAVLSAAEASAKIESATKEHRLIMGIRSRLPNADHAHRAIGNLFLAAGSEGQMYLGPYEQVTVNQNLLEIAKQEAKKQGIEKVDVKLLAAAVGDFRTTRENADFIRHLRHLFGNQKIDSIVRAAFTADANFVRRHPVMDGRQRYDLARATEFSSSFRYQVRTGALVELMARKHLTIEDVDSIFKDMIIKDSTVRIRWLHALSWVYDTSVLATSKETIHAVLKSNGYSGGQGLARYLRERHGLSVALTPKDAAKLETFEYWNARTTPTLIYQLSPDVLTNKSGTESMPIHDALAMVGLLSIKEGNKTTGQLYIGINDNQYHPGIGQTQIRETNSFVLESFANWMRETGHIPQVVPARPMSLRSALNSVRGQFLGCEGAFVSTK